MAQYGLQIWDGGGKEIFNSSKGNARYMGSFITPTVDGSRTISSIDGQPIVNLFAYTRTTTLSFQYTVVDANTVKFTSVWVEGNTIRWTGLGAGTSRIFYGDSYA